MKLTACDCSPLKPQPSINEANWLRKLIAHVRAADLTVALSSQRNDNDEPIVYCERDGVWWAGRYIGTISFEGNTLTITPRLGLATLRAWLAEATSIVLTPTPGQLREDDSFIVQLLASVWAHGFAEAARHGLPALRRDVSTQGPLIRGRLDVAASIRSISQGQVVSVRSERSLDHAASKAIVSAYVALRRWLGVRDEQWMPERAREFMPHLIAVTGARPRTPSKYELSRVRYTPITAGFAAIAELSRQIAERQGLATNVDAGGESQGVLLDVAELWEMYVLSIVRRAATPWTVSHGARERDSQKTLLRSDVTGEGMGTLIPDALLHTDETIHAVMDAKYKRLHPTAAARHGPQREDLYQVTAYLSRFPSRAGASWGALIYPKDPEQTTTPPAEQNGPWRLSEGTRVAFTTLPHDAMDAVTTMRALITSMTSVRGSGALRDAQDGATLKFG